MTRDADGFCRPQGSWPHCMALVGVRGGSRPGGFLLNSWGPDGPHRAAGGRRRVAGRLLGGRRGCCNGCSADGDSWAFSGVVGFPARSLDWYALRQPVGPGYNAAVTLALRTTAVPASPLARWDARWKLGGLLLLAAGAAAVTRPGPAAVAAAGGLGLALVRPRARVGHPRPARAAAALRPALPVPAAVHRRRRHGRRLRPAAGGRRAGGAGAGPHGARSARRSPPPASWGCHGRWWRWVLLAHRYAFLFAGELVRLRRAWRARGASA